MDKSTGVPPLPNINPLGADISVCISVCVKLSNIGLLLKNNINTRCIIAQYVVKDLIAGPIETDIQGQYCVQIKGNIKYLYVKCVINNLHTGAAGTGIRSPYIHK